jgi:hypothetical protein
LANLLNYDQILSALRQRREQIEEAILVMERLARGEANQPASLASISTAKRPGRPPARKKRFISEEGRRRIAEATRKRWAAKRAAQAAAAKKGASKKATKKAA